MATNEYRLHGKLQIVVDDCDGVIELGDIEIPIQVDFGNKPPRPGTAYRGDPGTLPVSQSFPTGSVGS